MERTYDYITIIPYSSNIYISGPRRGEPHLSHFSYMALAAGVKLWEENGTKVLLCGEDTFGPDKPNTSELMRQQIEKNKKVGLLALEHTVHVGGRELDNTHFQLDALRKFQKRTGKTMLLVAWDFHIPRIVRHGGLSADIVAVEDVLSKFYPKFEENKNKYKGVLSEFEDREQQAWIRYLSSFRGVFLKVLTRHVRGPSVTDVEVVRDNETGKKKLTLLNTTARERANFLS